MVPRICGVKYWAIVTSVFRRLCIFQSLNFSSKLVLDLVLMKMLGTIKTFSLNFTQLGRIVNPKKSKPLGYFFSEYPLRLTILVLVGCKVSLHFSILCLILLSTYIACFSVLQ